MFIRVEMKKFSSLWCDLRQLNLLIWEGNLLSHVLNFIHFVFWSILILATSRYCGRENFLTSALSEHLWIPCMNIQRSFAHGLNSYWVRPISYLTDSGHGSSLFKILFATYMELEARIDGLYLIILHSNMLISNRNLARLNTTSSAPLRVEILYRNL